jgi:radical SAM protein with 4Fe4S-binding SPASM domain
MRIENAVIELTNDCNLRCKHCYGVFEKKAIISTNDFRNIIDQLFDLGCINITLSGGEPLLLGPGIFDYFSIVEKKGIPFISLTTNGTIHFPLFYEIYKNFSLVQVSIDGLEETHDKIRGNGNFNKAVSFIQANLEYKNKTSIMMSIHKDNYRDLEGVHTLSKKLGVGFALELVTPCGRGSHIEMLSKYKLELLKEYVKNERINCNDPISFCTNENKRMFNNYIKAGCSACVSAICIDAYLNVYPCTRLRLSMGNIREKGILEILNNKIVFDLNDRNRLKGKCGKCDNKFICGGCRARAFAPTNDYLEEDDYCIDFIEL